ncbi:beta/gamma crystallin domain-containing protein 2 [Mantella aurantiaca]
MSSTNMESLTSKKQGLKKRLLRLFSRSEGNLKEKVRSRSEGDKSPAGDNHVEKKIRSSWSEKRGRKERNEVEEGAQSLTRLRHPRSEDSVLRRSTRDVKARSFSYSDLEQPSSNLLQRFGSLTWRKKKSSVLECNDDSSQASTPSRSHWSMGRLDRPAVGSDLDLKNRRPASCIVDSPYSEFTFKSSDQCTNRQHGEQTALQVSTSFDYLTNDGEDFSPSYPTSKGKNKQLQLQLTLLEKLEGEEDDSLPCWAESILKDYLTPVHSTPDSQLYSSYDESNSSEFLEEDEKPFCYRSPIHHIISSKDKIFEQTSKKGITLKTDVVFKEGIHPMQNSNTCTKIQNQNSQFQSQPNLSNPSQVNIRNAKPKNQMNLCTSSFSDDVTKKGNTNSVSCQNIPLNGKHNKTSESEGLKHLHSSTKCTKQKDTTIHMYLNRNFLQKGIQETIQSQGQLVQDTFKDKEHIVKRQMHSDESEHESERTTVQENIKGRTPPSTPKTKYQVIITMTKDEKKQSQLPAVAQELVKGDELVGQHLKLSHSLDSQACGYHGAGAREVIAQSLSETSEQPGQKLAQKEEISKMLKVSVNGDWQHLKRSLSLEADEDCLPTNSGSEQVAEYCRPYSSNMEKHDKLKKDDSNFPKRVQAFRVPEIQRSSETSKWSVKKNNQQNMNISNRTVSPQAYAGHVKNLQKVFEDISSKDVVSHHVEHAKPKHGSHREKDCVSDHEMSSAGLHKPVFSQIYNPLKKNHLEKRSEHALISVIDSSGKKHACIITENYMETSEDVAKNDRLCKDFVETEINNSGHIDKKAFQKSPRPTLQDLQLIPRTPTPPPQKIKTVSISLGSPKGWKNESAVVRPTKQFFGQRFEDQKDTSPMLPYSSNVFFTGSFSNSITDSELQQKDGQTNRNREIHSYRELNKSHTVGKSQEEHGTAIAPNFLCDERSPAVSAKEKLEKSRNERDLTLLKKEVQAEYEAHEDSGQMVKRKSKITDLQLEQKVKTESNTLDLVNHEKLGEDPIILNNQTSKFSNKIFPVKSQRSKPHHYENDVQAFQKQIPKFTEKKELGGSNESNHLRVNTDKHVSHITKGTMLDETSVISGGTDKKSTNHKIVQSRYPAIRMKKIENNVDLDADQLNQNKKKTENKVCELSSIRKQILKKETKFSEMGHQNEEKQVTHELVLPKSTFSTAYKDKSLGLINETITGHSKVEDESICKIKQKTSLEVETDISTGHNTNHELKQEASDKMKKDLILDKNVENISEVYLESAVKKTFKKSKDQPTTDMINAHTGHVGNKNINLENQTAPEVVKTESALNSSGQLLNKANNIDCLMGSVTMVEQKENSSDLFNEIHMYKPRNFITKDQIEDIKAQSLDTNNFSGKEILVQSTPAKNVCDLGAYKNASLINQGENHMVVSKSDDPLNFPDLLVESHMEEPSLQINESSTEGITIKSISMKDSIEKDFTGLTDSVVDSSKQIVYTAEKSTNMSVDAENMRYQIINTDTLLSGETTGQNLEDQMNLDENNETSVEIKKEPDENSKIQSSNINIAFTNVIEDENTGVEKNDPDIKEKNGQETTALVYPSAEFRVQSNKKPKERKYSSLTFSQDEDDSKEEYTTDATANENIDVENLKKTLEDAAEHTESIDKSVLEKLGWMMKDQSPGHKTDQVDGLMPVTSIVVLQEVSGNESCDQGTNERITQSFDPVDVVPLEKPDDLTQIVHTSEKTDIKSDNWTSALDQAMGEHANVTVEHFEYLTDLEVAKERKTENGQENEDQIDITINLKKQSQDFINIFTENDILKEVSEEMDQAGLEEQDEDQHEAVHDKEHVLDSAVQTETPATDKIKYEVNQTNNQVVQAMETIVTVRENPYNSNNSELIEDLAIPVVAKHQENDTAVLSKRNVDDKLVTLQSVEGESHLPLQELKTVDIQENVHELHTETSNSIALEISSEPLDVQNSDFRNTEIKSDTVSVMSQGGERQSHLSLPELKTINIQENVYDHHTETSNALEPVISSEPLEVQNSDFRHTETKYNNISVTSEGGERQRHLSLPALNTIDIQENVYEHHIETSNALEPVISSESLDVQNSDFRHTETKSDTISVTSQDTGRQNHLSLPELKTIAIQENVYEYPTETSNPIAPVTSLEPLDVQNTAFRHTETEFDNVSVTSGGVERPIHLSLPELKTIDIQENIYVHPTETSNSMVDVMSSEPLDVQNSDFRLTELKSDISLTSQGVEEQCNLPLPELKSISIQKNVCEHHTETSNSIAPVMSSELLDGQMSYLRDKENTSDIIKVTSQGVDGQSHLQLPELKTIDIQENMYKQYTESSTSKAHLISAEPVDAKMSYMRNTETTSDTISVTSQDVEGQSHLASPELKTIAIKEICCETSTEPNFIEPTKSSEPLDVHIQCLRSMGTTSDTVTVSFQDVEGQSQSPLPELKTKDMQENVYEHYREKSKSITPVMSSVPSDVQASYSRDTKPTSDTDRVDMESISSTNSQVPFLEECKLDTVNENVETSKDIPQIPKGDSNAAIEKNATPEAEEEESPENMESWVIKLRLLETPEFLRYQKPRRQPHSTPQFINITLPPIKEDQSSPKCDQPDFSFQLQEKEETLKVIAIPSENDTALEAKVTEQAEQSEDLPKKFSWERSSDRIKERISPLELMRKHSGDESSRSENYKALITQSLSQRQSSIIGSLLFSDRLDKKAESSEGKSYSRLESSYLLSSYIKPKKDIQQEITEQILSQDMSSANSTNSYTVSDSLTSTSEAKTASDSLNSASGANMATVSLTNTSGANTVNVSFTSASEENTTSVFLTNPLENNTSNESLTNASGANMVSASLANANRASDSLTSASGVNTENDSLTSASRANTAIDSLTSVSMANRTSDSLSRTSGANTANDPLTSTTAEKNTASGSLTSTSGANQARDSLTSAPGATTASDPLTSVSGANGVSDSLISASGANKASDSLTCASRADRAGDSLASASGANTASDSLTNASGANTESDPLPTALEANRDSNSVINASGANTANDFITSASGINKTSDYLSNALEANTATDSIANASGADTAIDSITSASEANTASDSLPTVSGANRVSDSISRASGANTANDHLTSSSAKNPASDPLTSESGATTASNPLTSASGANRVNDSLTCGSGANRASDSLASASMANTASDSLPTVSGTNRVSDSFCSASEANTASDSLPTVSGANRASDSLFSESEENTASDSLTRVSGTNIASDSLPTVSGANRGSESLCSASKANTASDSLTSISRTNIGSDSLDSASGENTGSDPLPTASGSNRDSDSLTNSSGANTASDSITSSLAVNKASDSLTRAVEANIASDSIANASGADRAIDSLTSASGANTASDSLPTVSEKNRASDSLSSASGANTASDSLTSASGANRASDSITNTLGANRVSDNLTNALGANRTSDSLTSESEANTASDSLTNALGANRDSDYLNRTSGANKASDNVANTSAASRASGNLANVSRYNRSSDVRTKVSQQPEDKDFSSQIPAPSSESTELPSKLEPPVAPPCKVFPDVWKNPGKTHGKLNPRPGKIILFSQPGFRGYKHEIYSDVGNMNDWNLQGTVSVHIVRGAWLLYEKPQFRGKRIMLTEGYTDLSCPWDVRETISETTPVNSKKPSFWIGSLRHVVRDFRVPQISLFMEENGEGNKVTIIGATPDSREHGQPTKTESIIVHSGLWLVYNKPFFDGDPYILEPGGYPNRKAWNGKDSHLCSLQPARIGGPTVEKPNEPKILLFKYPGFTGPVWELFKDLSSLKDALNSKGESLVTLGSIRVQGGCWVAYEKEDFHGHQYLLEEGKYKDWSAWGGCTEELGSLRHICTNFSEPEIVLYESSGCSDSPCLRLNEALSDIELAQYGTKTESIHVLNGVWIAYENVDFSGEQYILEKGIYHSYQDWGAKNSQICSVQPVLQVGGQSLQYFPKIQLFSESNFHGDCLKFVEDQALIPESFSLQSCRIEGGSWSLYEGEDCCGEQYILPEGDYPTRTAMGYQGLNSIRSLKSIPLYFSVPSISLHGLEKFEGKELNFTGEVRSLQGERYNNHVLSIRVKSGLWILYEHSDFRGRQWLLEHTQIPNWKLYSGVQRIGSLCPIRQRKVYFRLRNHVLGLFLCVPEPPEDVKAARVQLSEPQEGSCDLWFYEEGRIKNQLVPQMSLQVVGTANQGTKVVLWSEDRKPVQTWNVEDSGYIVSCLFKGMCLDVKGGQDYDSKHVVMLEMSEDRLTQRWDLEVY